METYLEHIALNVSDPSTSFPFYRDLFLYFGYRVIRDDQDHIAFRKDGTPDFWIRTAEQRYVGNGFHRKNIGINHFAFHVSSRQDVDSFYEVFIKAHGVQTLYDTPKLFSKYTNDYYAVFFEDPDRLKLEVSFFS